MEILIGYLIAALPIAEFYIYGIGICWLILAFFSGMSAEESGMDEFKAALVWPITLVNIIGLVFRGIFDFLFEENHE
jgi:hypothetical protein